MVRSNYIDLAEVNRRVREDPKEFVAECERGYAEQVSAAADMIIENMKKSPVVLLAGPSGSGKTTTAFKLEQELEERGVTTHSVSLDNYFKTVDHRTVPRTPEGDVDLESPLCLDMDLLNEHFGMLARGEMIRIPRYVFSRQIRDPSRSTPLRLKENEIAIFEGIHALNDDLTAPHPEAFKLYVTASGGYWINDEQILTRQQLRLMRRVVRDFNFRGANAAYTLEMWPTVIRGERLYIDPYKTSADDWINSTLAYEVAVMKQFAGKLFAELLGSTIVNEELQSILPALALFSELDPALTPESSLLREFIGGGIFNYG
ncbi:MAG: adenylyl-sulfate kinase [Oscillospiraceae bacterium]|nr:adenylyl-sulfate kinase [Oscillospiraceae bacterium]